MDPEELTQALAQLPAWRLRADRLALRRELTFASWPDTYHFLSAAGWCAACWGVAPRIEAERWRVVVTIKALSPGLSAGDLAVARAFEALSRIGRGSGDARLAQAVGETGDLLSVGGALFEDEELPRGLASPLARDHLTREVQAAVRSLLARLEREAPHEDEDFPEVPAVEQGPDYTLKLKSERIQGLLVDLPDWERSAEAQEIRSRFAFTEPERAVDFLRLARDLVHEQELRAALLHAEDGSVVATVRGSGKDGLTERDLRGAASLDRLYGRGQAP